MNHKRLYLSLILLVVGLVLSGCQSCQNTSKAPPPAAPAEVGEAPQPGDSGQAATEEEEIDEDALVLLAEGEPEDGEVPLSVNFVVESLIDDTMDGPTYKWDFGDGSPISTEASPTHVYTKPGSYTATIRIVDAKGERGWDEVDIEAEEP